MLTVLVDYNSGNLHSAQKAFERMAQEGNAGAVVVSSDPATVARADRIVLPGDGAFPACRAALDGYSGLFEAIEVAVTQRAVPFLGICIGMQMMATQGHEYTRTPGFGWIPGEVVRIDQRQAQERLAGEDRRDNDQKPEQHYSGCDGVFALAGPAFLRPLSRRLTGYQITANIARKIEPITPMTAPMAPAPTPGPI